jgi:hypothetical protein
MNRTIKETKRYYGILLADLKLSYAQGNVTLNSYVEQLRELKKACESALRDAADFERRSSEEYMLARYKFNQAI